MEYAVIYPKPALAFEVNTYVFTRLSRPVNLWISPQADAACVGLYTVRLILTILRLWRVVS